MDESALDAFEARAEAAEKRLAVLEAALLSPGHPPPPPHTHTHKPYPLSCPEPPNVLHCPLTVQPSACLPMALFVTSQEQHRLRILWTCQSSREFSKTYGRCCCKQNLSKMSCRPSMIRFEQALQRGETEEP